MTSTTRTLRGAILALAAATVAAFAEVPSSTAGAYHEATVSVIETRPCDDDTGTVTIDTARPVGFTLVYR